MDGKQPLDPVPLNPARAVALITRAACLLDGKMAEFLRPFGLSPAQYQALQILDRSEVPGCTCTHIAEQMLHRDPDITRLIDRMEQRGLVERSRCAVDRRVVRVRLSAAGQALLQEIQAPMLASIERLFGGLTGKQLSALCGLLRFVCGENRSDIGP